MLPIQRLAGILNQPSANNVSANTNDGKYRYQQTLLFQRAHKLYEKAQYVNSLGQTVTIPGWDYYFNNVTNFGYAGIQGCGTTNWLLCLISNWPWANAGGDWMDANLVKQGTTAWSTSAVIGAVPAGEFTLDVTSLIQYCDTQKRWYAFMLTVTSGELNITGPCNTSELKSTLEITRGGVTEVKDLWYAASIRTSTSQTDAQNDYIKLTWSNKTFIEFFREPADQNVAPTSAILRIRHGGVVYGSLSAVRVYLVDPLVPTSTTPLPGFAQNYPLDAGIFARPSVAAALRVTDTTTIDDILDGNEVGGYGRPWDGTSNLGTRREANFDPNLWGIPGQGYFTNVAVPSQTQLDALMPRKEMTSEGTKLTGSAAKSSVVGDTVRVVTSSELTQRGLPVLAPGMGAFEMTYHGCRFENGQATAQSITTGGPRADGVGGNDLEMYFKPEHIGQVVDGYMRMHLMLGEGWEPHDDGLRWNFFDTNNMGKWLEEYPEAPTNPQWRTTDFSGKFPGGIQQITGYSPIKKPQYPTRLDGNGNVNLTEIIESAGGGYSSTSGIYGYQGRWQFGQGFYRASHQGPARGGICLGIELYDFAQHSNCIPSQSGIAGWEMPWIGGLGFLYEKKWYCVEMRWKMNTITFPYAEPPIGTHYLESGFLVDGYLEWWIDGIFACKSNLFATRSSRMLDWALQIAQGKPLNDSHNQFRPMTNVPQEFYMGATTAVLQTYYGGRSPNPRDMKVLINGVVVSNGEYIGPMKGVTRANGGLDA